MPLVDPSTVIEYYEANGLDTTMLRKCNSQQLRYIGGIGKGYFLMKADTTVFFDSLYFLTNLTQHTAVDLHKVAIHALDPFNTDSLVIVETAEPKHYFTLYNVGRNYNVIVRRSYIAGNADFIPPDATPKTMEAIIEDITGKPCTFLAPSVTPLDVFIQGMRVDEAIDYLCAAHGFLWTYDGDTVFVWPGTSLVEPDISKVVDFRDNTVTPPIKRTAINFPVLDCCLEKPDQFYFVNDDPGAESGATVATYYPFFPAIMDTATGNITNLTQLNGLKTDLLTQYQAIEKFKGNAAIHEFYKYIDLYSLTIRGLAITYADYGAGPRTIIGMSNYPFLEKPSTEIIDNQAKNFVGYLYETYKGNVLGFWVVPTFGIDGKLPKVYAGDPGIWVVNLYKWDYGGEGAMVRVEWDCVNYRWIPLQQEYVCPPAIPTPENFPPTYQQPTTPVSPGDFGT